MYYFVWIFKGLKKTASESKIKSTTSSKITIDTDDDVIIIGMNNQVSKIVAHKYCIFIYGYPESLAAKRTGL